MAKTTLTVKVSVLDKWAEDIHDWAQEKGFWDEGYSNPVFGLKLALVHSEVTETLEAIRKNEGDDAVVEEVADTIIRLLDFFEAYRRFRELDGVDIPSLDDKLVEKHETNTGRPHKHGKRF